MTHPIEQNAARAITALRLDHSPKHEEAALHLVPGVYFSWDAGNGDVTLDIRPELGLLLQLEARVARAPEWLSFNLELGEAALNAGDVLGIVAEFEGCPGTELPVFLRSSREGEIADTWLQNRFEGSDARSVQTVLHAVKDDEPLAAGKGWHTLVMPLPRRDFRLELRDLRVFVLPASYGLTLGPKTVAEA